MARDFLWRARPAGLSIQEVVVFDFPKRASFRPRMATTLQGIDGKPIVVDSSKTIEVLPDGTVLQDGQEISRIAVVNFDNPKMLAKRGGNYFQSNASGTPPAPALQAEIRQGATGEGQLGFDPRSVEYCDDLASVRGFAEGHGHWRRYEPARGGGCRQGRLMTRPKNLYRAWRAGNAKKRRSQEMIRALYSAASGMNAQQTNIDNIANNLANSSTNGFKMRRAQFQDLIYQSLVQPGAAAGSADHCSERPANRTGDQDGLQRNHIFPRQLSGDRQSFGSNDPRQWVFSGAVADRPDRLHTRWGLRTR